MAGDKAKVLSEKLCKLGAIAKRLGGTTAQLSMAWVVAAKDLSTALTGASSTKQIEDTVACLKLLPLITPDVIKEIDEVMGTKPDSRMNFRALGPHPSRR